VNAARPFAVQYEDAGGAPFVFFGPDFAAPGAAVPARGPVREILESEDGQCFERVGNRLRRLDEAPQAKAAHAPLLKPVTTTAPLRLRMAFGQWRALLASQLAHPERLRDSHQVACELRVFELSRDAAEENVGQKVPVPVGRLDRRNAALLGIEELLGEELPPRPEYRRGERVFLARVTQDPTRRIAKPPAAPVPEGPKTKVPDRFVTPFAFSLSREEAEAELGRGARKSWVARIAQWFERGERAGRLEAWRQRLEGADPEGRLWQARPPRGELASKEIVAWAECALRQAGYQPAVMLREWQIYWTRKGV